MKYFKTPHDRKPQPKNEVIDGIKVCNKCGYPKPIADFPRAPQSKSGYGPICRKCNNEAVKALKASKNFNPFI